MNSEIVELLWVCGIEEKKHQVYVNVIEACLVSINRISSLFSERLGDNVNYELKIKTEDRISPDAGPMWGVHLIIFQVKFIIELVKHYEKLYAFKVEVSLNEQRKRRLMLAVCLAYFHELTHIIRGHDSNVINVESPNGLGSKAAEADADFLAGMQLHKWFTGAAIGSELKKDIGINDDLTGLPIFFKDAGFCTVLLSFFLHQKLNQGNLEYHSPNIRAVILLAGFLSGATSPPQNHYPYVKFMLSGYKEHIEYLENNVSILDEADEVRKFLTLCSLEEKEILRGTAAEMDNQRKISDKIGEVWKELYRRAKNK